MQNFRIAFRYGRALLRTATELNCAEEVFRDVKMIRSMIYGSDELKAFLKSPVIEHLKKKSIVRELLHGRVHQLTEDFVLLLTHKGREAMIGSIMEAYDTLYLESTNQLRIDVASANPVSEELQARLAENLSAKLSKKIIPTFHVEEKLLGGMVLKINDEVFDGSLQRRLELIRHKLIGAA